MSHSLNAVARAAREVLSAYLELYPGEAQRFDLLRAQLEQDNPSVLVRSNMTGHITTSMVVFDPVTRKVLVIFHGIYRDWMPSGGHFEMDPSLWLSAAREVHEETGVVVAELAWSGRGSTYLPIDIDTHPIPENPKKGEGAHFHHDFTFVATASSDVPLVPQTEEVDAADWVDLAQMHKSKLERVRRLAAKLEKAFPASND
jgi:8-oxo-dGTP pyrophosphatase MutT (NUDIX family)